MCLKLLCAYECLRDQNTNMNTFGSTWSLRICISNKPQDADAAGPGSTRGERLAESKGTHSERCVMVAEGRVFSPRHHPHFRAVSSVVLVQKQNRFFGPEPALPKPKL